MNTNDIKKMMEAYLEVVSEKKAVKKEQDKLDPVNDKENDKKFKDRKDKDIDNDGDVDSSDEYLHKKRKATDDAIDGGEKPADNADDGEEKDDKKKVAANKKGKTAEISKIGEKAVKKEDIDQFLDALEEAQKASAKPKGDEAEKIDDKYSPKAKEMKKDHDESEAEHEKHQEKAVDATVKAGQAGKEAPKRPGDNKSGDKNVVNPVKEDNRTFQQKIMDVLSGKSMGEITQEDVDMLNQEDKQ